MKFVIYFYNESYDFFKFVICSFIYTTHAKTLDIFV